MCNLFKEFVLSQVKKLLLFVSPNTLLALDGTLSQ